MEFLLSISSFVFHGRNKVMQVWNDMKASANFQFWSDLHVKLILKERVCFQPWVWLSMDSVIID